MPQAMQQHREQEYREMGSHRIKGERMSELHDTPEEVELPPLNLSKVNGEYSRRSVIEVRERQLKSSLAANREQKATLADRDNHIDLAYKALGDVNRSVYLFDHIREQKAEIERLNLIIESPSITEIRRSKRITELEAELASLRASVGGEKWIDVKQELPPVGVWVLGWLFLPKNPPASGCSIAQYTGCKRDEPESFGRVRMTVDCWWANGTYYSSGHFTHWQPLPAPPTLPGEEK